MSVPRKPSSLEALRNSIAQLTAVEQQILQRFVQRAHISRNTNVEFDSSLTAGQRLADRLAAFGGSWIFLGTFLGLLFAWITLNSLLSRPFDPYPYILLNLFLSMLAAIQAPVILMSQNRQAARDRLDASNDYEVNLKAEIEIMALHGKIDSLREAQWSELIALQQAQIQLLTSIDSHLSGSSPSGDVYNLGSA